MPKAVTKADCDRLLTFKKLAERFVYLIERAARPVAVPSGCRRCFKGAKRTSCGLFYKLVFGEVKQLGIVLKNTHKSK